MRRIKRADNPDIPKPAVVRNMRIPTGIRPRGRVRRKAGEMNDTERRFMESVLEPAMKSGEILAYYFEQFTWVIAPGCRYTPDFLVIESCGAVKLYDVKGAKGKIGCKKPYIEDDSRVKMKSTDYYSPFPVYIAFEQRAHDFSCNLVSQE